MSADVPRLRTEFERLYGSPPEIVSEAPSRVNLIGEHTDYNGGLVLPVAIDRTVAVAVTPRDDGVLRVRSLDFGQSDEFRAEAVRRFGGTKGGWRDYVRGVVWALLDAHIPVGGADVAILGDVPQGAGLSSSAALELAAAGALTAASGVEVGARELALLCQKAENLFAGVQCGIMDQFASALGVEGHALLIDCQSLELEAVSLPGDVAIVIIDSKVPRKLSDTAYNQRREECAEAARTLGTESLRGPIDMGKVLALPETLSKRATHVITENIRVRTAAAALKNRDMESLGEVMYASHESLQDDFAVSTPELDLLVRLARGAPGAIGAKLTGAGFGGCTVNLVRRGEVSAFAAAVLPEYEQLTGLAAEMHVCRAVDGLRVTRA